MLALRQALATVIDAKAIAIPIVEAYGVHVAMLSDRSLIDNASFVLVVRADVPARACAGTSAAGQGRLGGAHPRLRQPATAGYRPAADAGGAAADPYHAGSTYFELTAAARIGSS